MNTITVANNQFFAHYPKRIPKGTVEAERVLVRLDSEWDGLTVRIHWANQASGKEVVSLLERDKPNSIPWEVLSDLGELRMGLLGLDGETTVKPTIWLSYGYVVEGVDPESGDDPQPPTPSWEQQMVEQATAAAEASKAAQEAAELAGPYAQAAQASAEAAKASEGSAAASAQAAGQSQAAAEQAQVSAQGHASAAQQAQAAAEQAAQEAQAAQESAAQSAQDAATDAQRAETASQEAQDAAARAEAVDAYPRQEANDRFALALKTDTGKGTTHEIYPDPGSNVVVTAYGFTEQEGEGDPSPENVRPIKVGGMRLHVITFDGSDDERWQNRGGTIANTFSIDVKNIANYKTDPIVAYSTIGVKQVGSVNEATYDILSMYSSSSSPDSRTVYVRKDGIVDLPGLRSFLSKNPITLWYETDSGDGDLYTPADLVGGQGCLPLTEPLCDGDYVVSMQDGQCVEVHQFAHVVISSDLFKAGTDGDISFIAAGWDKIPKCIRQSTSVAKCSHFKPSAFNYNASNIVLVLDRTDDYFSSKEELLAYCDEQRDAGTPVQLVYHRDLTGSDGYPNTVFPADGTYTHASVPLIAKPDVTGKVTVSGEKKVSAVYNKSLKKAFEELQTAILNLGGNT